MCRYEWTVCGTCDQVIDIIDEQCERMKVFFCCDNGQAFRKPQMHKAVCYACIRWRMLSIRRAIENPPAEETTTCVDVWLSDVSSPAESSAFGSTSDGSVVLSPG